MSSPMKIIQITTCGITDKEIEYLQKHLKNIKFKEDSLEETNTHLSHSQPLSREETLSISNSLSLSKIAKDKVMDVIVTKKLTSKTDFIVVNRPMFTKKYIQAIYWRIPIIDIKWLYALGSYKSFKRGIFQNIVFSTSDIKNPIFKNYFIAQGAIYSENLSIKCDFLIADGEGQMTSYAEKVGIPIIGTKDVFKNNYNLFLKPSFYHCSGDQNLFPSNNGGVDKYRKLSEEYPEINEGGLIKGNVNKSPVECSENCEPNDNKIGSDKKIDRLFVENFEILNQITQNNSPGKDEHWDIKIISPLNSQTNRQLFENKTFYIDENLPKTLKNILRRLIIENGGIRLAKITQSQEIDFRLGAYGMEFTGNIMNYRKNGARISFSIKNLCDRTGNSDFINYSYVFECIESGYVLSTIPYLVQNGEKHQIFSNLSFKVKNDPEVINKIRALGGVLKDVNATYEVTDTMRLNKNCITVTWIDRCLYSLKINDKLKLFKRFKINEIQYKDESISMMNKNFSTRDNQPPKHIREEKNIVFQFTGLPTLLKTKAMEKLRALGIRYIDSMSYEGATHLIMGDINMSEKYLCTLVSGGIILGVDFIDNLDISKADQYVWNVVGLQKKELKIVMGIKYWHDRISREGLPFINWRVKVYSEKKDVYEKILKCGGAELSEIPTHIFVAKDYGGNVDFEHFSTDYIFNYIFRRVSTFSNS